MKLLPLMPGKTGAICLENFNLRTKEGFHIYREIDDLKGTNADFRGIKNIYNSFNARKELLEDITSRLLRSKKRRL